MYLIINIDKNLNYFSFKEDAIKFKIIFKKVEIYTRSEKNKKLYIFIWAEDFFFLC